MRDDIHRLAPVPPRWKRLIRACANDADWSDEGPEAAKRAAVDDLRRGLSPSFLNDLAKAACVPELFARETIDRLCQRQLEPFTLRVAAHMKRAAEQGASTGQAIADGIAAAIRESANAQLRNTDGHLARRFPRERADMMARLR